MVQEGTRAKLAHERWTGPWRVTAIERQGIRYQATMSGRRTRRRTVSATNIKAFHDRPEHLRHAFEDEFAHLAWGADLVCRYLDGSGATLHSDGPASHGGPGDRVGVAVPRMIPKWGGVRVVVGREVRGSVSPLQLDVFHALWGVYKGKDCRSRPPEPLPKEERDQGVRTRALQDVPTGTQVRRSFAGCDGVSPASVERIYDFREPYWRVRYPDGNW